jgi:hypothetical protein
MRVVVRHAHDIDEHESSSQGGQGLTHTLNHAAIHSQLAATYNGWRYQPAVRAALQRLAEWLDSIATGGSNNVVALRPAAS